MYIFHEFRRQVHFLLSNYDHDTSICQENAYIVSIGGLFSAIF